MEAGTLDFEDLMDTGDEYPGFGIEKFSPANRKDGDDDDSVLRTPEHKPEDDDFVITENKDAIDDTGEQVENDADKLYMDDEIADKVEDDTQANGEGSADVDDQVNDVEGDADDSGKDNAEDKGDDGDNDDNTQKHDDENTAHENEESAMNGNLDESPDSDQEKQQSLDDVEMEEPAMKKKKYMQAPKPRMKLWGGSKTKRLDEGESRESQGIDPGEDSPSQRQDDRESTAQDGNDSGEGSPSQGQDDDEESRALDGNDSGEASPSQRRDEVESKEAHWMDAGEKSLSQSPAHRGVKDEDEYSQGQGRGEDDHEDFKTSGDTDNEQREASPDKTEGDNEDDTQEVKEGEKTGDKKKMTKDKQKDNKEDEEDPHQQSFLSFLNLQPGISKPVGAVEKKEQDFYSRKRLRTRKKVSYVEDVKENSDDDYKAEEDEPEEDHILNVRSPNQRRVRTNSKSPIRNAAAVNYAKALQNISSQYSHAAMQQAAQMSIQQQKTVAAQLAMQKAMTAKNKLLQMPNLVTDLTGSNNVGGASGQIKGLFECGLCGTFFNTASQFISHQEIAHAEENKKGKSGMETFRCEICQFVLTNRFAYLEHKRMKHMKSQVSFSCSKCGKNFPYLMDMQKHKETCGGGTAPWCGQCNARFKNMQELQLHRSKVHGTPATRQWLNCVNKSCNFKCLTQHEMKIHIQNKHMINELFPCNAPRCARIFSTREQLNEHKKEAHASEFIVQYQCMECKMCYSSKTLLAEHQYLHTMDKLKKCDICMRQFGTSSQLKKHKEVHACKGTEQCTACTRWCFDKQELVSHVCSERRGRPIPQRLYFCDICLKDFKADEPMFAHRKEHKKYYQCGTCLWECSTEADYFEHREIHGMFTCKECCEEIPSSAELEAHEKAHGFYVKMEEQEEDGTNQPVMYLCPNLLNTIKA